MQVLGDFMINAELILKQLQCAVCINEVTTPYLTKCGHCFCYNCIEEVINRYHKCPLCNSDLQKTDMFPNNHLNSIKSIIDEERQKEVKKKLNVIFGEQKQNEFLPNYQLISQMFYKAVAQMYNVFESKYIEAAEEYKARVYDLKQEYQQKLTNLKQDIEKVQLEENLKLSLQQTELNFNQLKQYYSDCVAKSLENFKCDQIDILIQIVIPKQQQQFAWPFKVNNRINNICNVVQQHFEKLNDPIQNFDPQKLGIAFCKPQDLQKLSLLTIQDQIDQIKESYQIYPMNSDMFLASLGQVKQGAIIVVIGNIQLSSQLPVECITYKFDKDKLVDYFSCQQCGIHWICQNCKDHCHKNHQLSVYRKQVKPDWACCYCVSKGFCKALNKNKK